MSAYVAVVAEMNPLFLQMAEEEDVKISYEIRPDMSVDFGKKVLCGDAYHAVYVKEREIRGTLSMQGAKLTFQPGHPMLMAGKDVVALVMATGKIKVLSSACPGDVDLARDCAIAYGIYPQEITITNFEHRLWKMTSFTRRRLAVYCGLPIGDELTKALGGKKLEIPDFIKALLDVAGVVNSLPETEMSQVCKALVKKGQDWPVTFS